MDTLNALDKHIIALSLWLLLLLPGAFPAAAQPAETVDASGRLGALLNHPELSNAFWGVHVVNLETGNVIYSRNAKRSFVPASNLKLFTTAAALHLLGPNFRYATDLFIDGTVRNDTLYGNLVVRGSGDPSIGGRFTGGDRTQVFRAWADSLLAAGVSHITGDVIGDDDIFDDKPLAKGWSWNDLKYWYAAPLSGLSFNDNCVDVTIEGNRLGEPGTVSWRPFNTDYVTIKNETVTVAANQPIDEGYERPLGTNQIRLTSQVPAKGTDTESLSVHNPTLYFTHTLRETLGRSGVTVAGQAADIDKYPAPVTYGPDFQRVARHHSPPLKRIVRVINKRSQNLYADQLLKTMGMLAASEADDKQPQGSFQSGVAAVKSFLAWAGADTNHIQLADGSGLSRKNLITPEAATTVLQSIWNHPDPQASEAFYNSLPVGGVDGTLKFRFADTSVRGNVRAKTGYLSNVRSLSGYLTTQDGTPLAFSLVCNHYTVATNRVDYVQNAFVRRLADLILN